MADVLINDEHLHDIADAIRGKVGGDDTYKPREMAAAIEAIEGKDLDCNGMHVPEEVLVISGDCDYYGARNQLNWLIEQYGNKMRTENISNPNSMFYFCAKLKEIPFDLNVLHSGSTTSISNIFTNIFNGCYSLKKFPKINLTSKDGVARKVFLNFPNNMFEYPDADDDFVTKDDATIICGMSYNSCSNAKFEVEPSWFSLIDCDAGRENKVFGSQYPVNWSGAKYIKSIPSYPKFWNNQEGSYSHYYSMKFIRCYNLHTIVIPRPGTAALTSSPQGFNADSWNYTYSLKNILFDVQEDGSPYTANWKNVTLNLCVPAANPIGGDVSNNSVALSVLNPDKAVTDEESYQRLKNDLEYWVNIRCGYDEGYYHKYGYYSGFNRATAFNLIKTLPDTSAYGVNVLKLPASNGEGTDAGAISTLTEEEIAVATVKGWTVTFV